MKKNLLHRSLSRGVTSGGSSSGSYTVNLNGQWEQTTAVSNPDSSLYDGVYRSASNYNVNNGVATMYITIKDCSSFKMYIRSYAEPIYDYVMVSQLDQTITGSTSYSNTTLVKAHTRGNQQSGTALSNYTTVEFTGISSGEHTITVVYRKDSSVNSGESGDEGGSNEGPIDIANYLTIEALEDGLTASLSVNTCEYCVDGDGNWQTIIAGTTTRSINTGQTLSFRGVLQSTDSSGIGTFTISKKCNLIGNCMSMLFSNDAANNTSFNGMTYTFSKLFYNCSNIVTVSSSFLPATTLESYCYQYMFCKCTSLTTAPELPATTLKDYCYAWMFYKCSKLNYIKMLATNISAYSCLKVWVHEVASTGTFVKHTNMTSLPTGTSGIPSGWTVQDATS